MNNFNFTYATAVERVLEIGKEGRVWDQVFSGRAPKCRAWAHNSVLSFTSTTSFLYQFQLLSVEQTIELKMRNRQKWIEEHLLGLKLGTIGTKQTQGVELGSYNSAIESDIVEGIGIKPFKPIGGGGIAEKESLEKRVIQNGPCSR